MQSRMICYCFNHTEQDIIDDMRANRGKSAILEKIKTQKKTGGCNCQWHHPERR